MRTIKFKGKDKNGVWRYGSLRKSLGGSTWIEESYLREVDPETICQYTGLKDMNGTEIWEGDVLLNTNTIRYFGSTNGEKVVVFWNRASFQIIEIRKEPIYDHISSLEFYKVVGNRFDNPELLGNLQWNGNFFILKDEQK